MIVVQVVGSYLIFFSMLYGYELFIKKFDPALRVPAGFEVSELEQWNQVADELNSRMVLGETHPEAAYLPAIPGRGVFRFGNTIQEVQTMYLPIDQAREMLSSIEHVPPVPEPEIKVMT